MVKKDVEVVVDFYNMKFFEFNKKDYIKIVEECMLNEDYAKLLELKIKGYSRTKIALEMKYSVDNIDKMTQKLKKKITKIL